MSTCPYCGVSVGFYHKQKCKYYGMKFNAPASPVQGAASMADLVQRKQGGPARRMAELVAQGAASSEPAWGKCQVLRGAASSASGAKGAAVAYFRKASSFGPWIECKPDDDGATRFAALAERAQAAQPTPSAEFVQWRNIQKTVKELAKFCFGDGAQMGQISLGAAYTSLVNALTAKDGLSITLEPLSATPAPEQEAAQAGWTNYADETGGAVKRFGFDCTKNPPEIIPAGNGAYVHYSDYAKLFTGAAAPVAPPGAQEVYQVPGRKGGWLDVEKVVYDNHADWDRRTLYTAPVPATTPAEQPDPIRALQAQARQEKLDDFVRAAEQHQGVMRPFGAPAGQHGAWIGVEDRLPELGQSVAFVAKCEGLHAYLNGRVLGGKYTDGGFGTPGLVVDASHWMLLPPPPEQSAASGSREGRDAQDESSGEGCATATNTNQPEGAGESQ